MAEAQVKRTTFLNGGLSRYNKRQNVEITWKSEKMISGVVDYP